MTFTRNTRSLILLAALMLFIPADACNWQYTRNAAIRGHNDFHLEDVTVWECKEACCGITMCKSFDYYKNSNECDLSYSSAADVGGLKTDYSGDPYDHYAVTRSSNGGSQVATQAPADYSSDDDCPDIDLDEPDNFERSQEAGVCILFCGPNFPIVATILLPIGACIWAALCANAAKSPPLACGLCCAIFWGWWIFVFFHSVGPRCGRIRDDDVVIEVQTVKLLTDPTDSGFWNNHDEITVKMQSHTCEHGSDEMEMGKGDTKRVPGRNWVKVNTAFWKTHDVDIWLNEDDDFFLGADDVSDKLTLPAAYLKKVRWMFQNIDGLNFMELEQVFTIQGGNIFTDIFGDELASNLCISVVDMVLPKASTIAKLAYKQGFSTFTKNMVQNAAKLGTQAGRKAVMKKVVKDNWKSQLRRGTVDYSIKQYLKEQIKNGVLDATCLDETLMAMVSEHKDTYHSTMEEVVPMYKEYNQVMGGFSNALSTVSDAMEFCLGDFGTTKAKYKVVYHLIKGSSWNDGMSSGRRRRLSDLAKK